MALTQLSPVAFGDAELTARRALGGADLLFVLGAVMSAVHVSCICTTSLATRSRDPVGLGCTRIEGARRKRQGV